MNVTQEHIQGYFAALHDMKIDFAAVPKCRTAHRMVLTKEATLKLLKEQADAKQSDILRLYQPTGTGRGRTIGETGKNRCRFGEAPVRHGAARPRLSDYVGVACLFGLAAILLLACSAFDPVSM